MKNEIAIILFTFKLHPFLCSNAVMTLVTTLVKYGDWERSCCCMVGGLVGSLVGSHMLYAPFNTGGLGHGKTSLEYMPYRAER